MFPARHMRNKRPLRGLFLTGISLLLAGTVTGVALAAPFKVNVPSSFQEVTQNITQVTQNLGEAMCGGWNLDESVVGKIPAVQGAPGRANLFGLGGIGLTWELKSGLARRDEWGGRKGDGFQFPTPTQGKSTACNVNEETKDHCDNKFPYISDPYVDGDTSCMMPQELDPRPPEGSYERKCNKLCDELNKWVRGVVVWDGTCDILPGTEAKHCRNDACAPNDSDKLPFPPQCYDEEGILHCHHTDVQCCTNSCVDQNCIPCSGDDDGDETGCREGATAENGRTYISYYRRYIVNYARNKVQEVANDKNSLSNLIVRCYARLNDQNIPNSMEFDPKEMRTTNADQHCVLDFITNMDALKMFRNMKDTQKGKGEYGQNSSLPDPTYPVQRRNTLRDLWVTTLGSAFSLHDGEKVEDLITDPTYLPLVPDSADITPTAQITSSQPYSSGSLIRAFDDTISVVDRPGRRTLTEWWQEQETQMHKLLTPPILRLLLPSPSAEGVRLDTSLLTPKAVSPAQPSSPDGLPPHTKAIDIQIHADTPDLLDDVSRELADSLLLNVREAPVKVIVPLASPVELRAMAQGWLIWGKGREDLDGENARGAEQVSDKLLEYAKQIEDVRKLRAELAQYAGKVLTFQQEMSSSIADWLDANVSGFQSYQSEWEERIAAYRPLYQTNQQLMRQFHDKTNFPWCRNERFTTPIYSLLDPWMPPEISPGGSSGRIPRDLVVGIDESPSDEMSELPRIEVEPMPDIVVDFSALRIGSGGVVLPVLKPVQIRLDLGLFRVPASTDSPDDIGERLGEINRLPGRIPEIPSIFGTVKNRFVPSEVLKNSSPATLSESVPPAPEEAMSVLQQTNQMLRSMNSAYEKFWTSLQEDRSADINLWNCVTPGALPCVHVEMDMMERFTRIGARPAVLLKEDLQSLGYMRTASSSSNSSLPFSAPDPIKVVPPCPRADWSCQVINVEMRKPRTGWWVEGMDREKMQQSLEKLQKEQREKTMPKDKDDAFHYDVQPDDALPSYNVTMPIRFTPVNSAASASASIAP